MTHYTYFLPKESHLVLFRSQNSFKREISEPEKFQFLQDLSVWVLVPNQSNINEKSISHSIHRYKDLSTIQVIHKKSNANYSVRFIKLLLEILHVQCRLNFS